VLLPFLAEVDRHRRRRVLGVCALVVALGLGASLAFWGTSTFLPLRFALERESAGSIDALLRGARSPVRLFWPSPNVDWVALPCLAGAGLAVFAVCRDRRTGPAASAVAAVLVTLLFYQFVLDRYYMVPFCLASYWAVRSEETPTSPFVRVLAGLFFAWLGVWGVVAIVLCTTSWISYGWWALRWLTIPFGFALLAAFLRARPVDAQAPA